MTTKYKHTVDELNLMFESFEEEIMKQKIPLDENLRIDYFASAFIQGAKFEANVIKKRLAKKGLTLNILPGEEPLTKDNLIEILKNK